MSTNRKKYRVRCIKCGGSFQDIETLCPMCGGLCLIEYEKIEIPTNKKRSIWRYIDGLPIRNEPIISLEEGFTPLISARKINKKLGLKNLYIKDETRNPMGAFIDRGMSVEITKFKEKYKHFVCPTLGDTGASISAYCARAGIKSTIYVPEKTNIGKLYQMLLCGAHVNIVRSFEAALYFAETHRKEARVFSEASPYYMEGIKTIAYEIAEQLKWISPDYIIVPMGTGALITAIYKGFRELLDAEKIDTIPRLVGVQIEGADAISRAFKNEEEDNKLVSTTFAIDLHIERPIWRDPALLAIKKTHGLAISIENSLIPEFIKLLAETEGIIAEPAAIVSIIALSYLIRDGSILPSEKVVSVITGSGLKTIDILMSMIPLEKFSKKIIGSTPKAEIKRLGETKIRILQILSKEPMHGYKIKKMLKNIFGIDISFPTIYQHLQDLLEYGLVSRITKQKKKRTQYYYILTKKGRILIKKIL